MKYYRRLVSERLYLSPMCADDAPLYTKWLNDPSVIVGLGADARLQNVQAEKEWLESVIRSGSYNFSIVCDEGDRLLGSCGVNKYDPRQRSAEVGLFIGEEEDRNKGYGAEALRLLIGFCFDTLAVHSVRLNCFAFNERAIACYKKVGMKECGRLREACFAYGRFWDEIHMDILEEEWKEITK